jgi:hypothetical protein
VAQWLQQLGPFDSTKAVPAPALRLAPDDQTKTSKRPAV